MAKPECFAVRRGDDPERLDPRFNHPRYGLWSSRLAAAPVATPDLGSLLGSIASGATPQRSDESLYAAGGIKFFRIMNVEDGEILERDLKHIAAGVHSGDLSRSQLESGDVLLTITGRVGSAAVVREEHLPANINQHIARLRVNRERCRPEFLSEWLNCPAGLDLSNRAVSGGTRIALDYKAVRSIPIPLPALAEQDRLVAAMAAARGERREKLAAADGLLTGLDDFVLGELGVERPAAEGRRVFGVKNRGSSYRFDPHFHSPEFVRNTEMISQVHCESLGGIATFSKEVWQPKDHTAATFRYIEISTVNPQTGDAAWSEVPTQKAPSRARMQVQPGDIIVSLTRPHHGSIARLNADFAGCIASTGFAVIRGVADGVQRDYLWCVLRAQFCLRQMLQRASGGNYPAITEDELAKVLIPLPNLETQARIVAEFQSRREQAARLRAEAEAGWQAAREWFEETVLGK